jgi:phytoene dehydrogenase-like protein
VQNLNLDNKGKVTGVTLEDGQVINAKYVISNCDMNVTYNKLLTKEQREKFLPEDFLKGIQLIDYNSSVVKINLIIDRIPKFKCFKSMAKGDYDSDYYNKVIAQNYLTGTLHINAVSLEMVDDAYKEALYSGKPSTNPIIEMTIPSLLDKTLVPEGSKHHTVGLFIQYCPNKLNIGTWDKQRKRDFAKRVYECLDKYCYDFSKSIIFEDILSPLDLEKEFSLTGGSIFHGGIDIYSIFIGRPVNGYSNHKQPLENLWSCSSAMHPGGGVLGGPGKLCAESLLKVLH